jgi:Na+/H+ antiporter NhaD/arsenite permease-like protein
MTAAIVLIFSLVYLGMILGGLPFLQLDRTGVALLGAMALVGIGAVSPDAAVQSLHLPTLILLFAFMVVSAQLRLGGFYAAVTRRLATLPLKPPLLLGALILGVAALSAVFSNDIVCLAVAPVLIDACRRRNLDPMPYLLALACAANIGSAATLIGNPQNMLIGATLRLSFSGYAVEAIVPVLLGLLATWGIIVGQVRGRWIALLETDKAIPVRRADDVTAFHHWQTTKGLTVAMALLGVFLFTSWPREAAALVGAGVLLTSRQLHSRQMLGLVDWLVGILATARTASAPCWTTDKAGPAGARRCGSGSGIFDDVLLQNLVPERRLVQTGADGLFVDPVQLVHREFPGNRKAGSDE